MGGAVPLATACGHRSSALFTPGVGAVKTDDSAYRGPTRAAAARTDGTLGAVVWALPGGTMGRTSGLRFHGANWSGTALHDHADTVLRVVGRYVSDGVLCPNDNERRRLMSYTANGDKHVERLVHEILKRMVPYYSF